MIEHRFHALHVVGESRAPERASEWTGIEVRRLRSWVEQCIRLEDNDQAHELLAILNEIVYEQARQIGMTDALEIGESRAPQRAGVYRDGYEVGFAEGMSRKAGEL